jgi:hypothetical protein
MAISAGDNGNSKDAYLFSFFIPQLPSTNYNSTSKKDLARYWLKIGYSKSE